VWYADFDGVLPTGTQDTFCDALDVCTTVRANVDETVPETVRIARPRPKRGLCNLV
jgi:hypothetical protein